MNAPDAPLAAVANPLLDPACGATGLPPFADLRPEHFVPAFEAAMAEHLQRLDAIAAQPRPAGFADTVAAFDRAGERVGRLRALFHNLCAAHTGPALQAVEREMAPRLAAHDARVAMHAGVFERLDDLHARREALGLDPQALRLLERLHLDFVRGGARLQGAAREEAARLQQELAGLHTAFTQNVLADESGWQMVLRTEDELAGLPGWWRAAARGAAAQRGVEGADAHVVTLSRSLVVPFLTHSLRRDLRETAWRAWVQRGEHAGAHDNRPLIGEILQRRLALARLHGRDCFADWQLEDTMAGTIDRVQDLLLRVWRPARERALAEREDLAAMARQRGEPDDVQPWDWRFLAEQVRAHRFQVDDSEVKPYFALDAVLAAAFDVAGRLFGLRFRERPDLPTYQRDVRVFEVSDGAGAHVGLFLSDNFARPEKRSGAWMSVYRLQTHREGEDRVPPVIANHNNFAQAAPGEDTLLSLDDARTLFHEFGHGLHGLLSDVRYERLSGTRVLRDFVELPSQLFEHWLMTDEVLQRHARHHRTGAPIPADLVERLRAARRFNQGFDSVEVCASALVDIALHARTDGAPADLAAWEAQQLEALGMPPGIVLRHRLPHFQHLFSSAAYASGYYVYLWAEVLDADAFEAFQEAGDVFDAATAQRLRRFIYGSGASMRPQDAWLAFRGREAAPEPMLRKKGLLAA